DLCCRAINHRARHDELDAKLDSARTQPVRHVHRCTNGQQPACILESDVAHRGVARVHDESEPRSVSELSLNPIFECLERSLDACGGLKPISTCVREIAVQPEQPDYLVAADLAVRSAFSTHSAHARFTEQPRKVDDILGQMSLSE